MNTFRPLATPLRPLLSYALASALAIALSLAACTDQHTQRAGPMPVDPQDRISNAINPALRRTVGEYCTLVDASPIAVEGWGLVVNLHGNGSSDMDPRIHDYLVDQLVKSGAASYVNGTQHISPQEILASNDIAVVEVRGVIPPLARRGSTFDLTVTAIAGSQTRSLVNGLLWTSNLKTIGLTLDENDTSTIALGRGPVFISGPVEAAADGKENADIAPRALRTARVLAGGTSAIDRPIRLQMYSPSARMTKIIEHVINSRFPGRDKTADAQDDATINLRIPREYNLNPASFIELVKHLYLVTDTPGFTEQQATLILKTLQEPGTPRRDLSVALQGLGRSIIPEYIEPQYTSPNAELRFWCARAGANMQDTGGMIALQEIIGDRSSAFRRQAVDAMVEASIGRDTERASLTLAKMLDSANTDDRVRGYQGLVAIRSRLVQTWKIGATENNPIGKFLMDIVPTDSPPMIYVTQAETPRIAFIGRPIKLPAGAVYVSPDRLLTVVAREDGPAANAPGAVGGLTPIAAPPANPKEAVTLYFRPPSGGRAVTLKIDTFVPDLVSLAAWEPNAAEADPQPFIGASYQRMTEMLGSLCAKQILPAKFVLQAAPPPLLTTAEIINSGRPEGSVLPSTQPATQPATTEPMFLPAGPAAPPVAPPVAPPKVPQVTPLPPQTP